MAIKETVVLDVKSPGEEYFWTYVVKKADSNSERTIHNTSLFHTNHLWVVERTDESTFAERELRNTIAPENTGGGIAMRLSAEPSSVTEIVIDTLPADKIDLGSQVQFGLDSGEFKVAANSPDKIFDIRLLIPRPLGNTALYLASQVS